MSVVSSSSIFYLFASPAGTDNTSSATVFYKVEGELLAKSLCGLFRREYADASGHPAFHHRATDSISVEEQVLCDEALDWLAVYSDPDPGIYDEPPSKEMHLRAQYAVRAGEWERLLRQRIGASDGDATPDTKDSGKGSAPVNQLPEMPAEDRRNSGLVLLLLVAQAYYKMLECTSSMASWFTALDLQLNQCYLWTVTTIRNLLERHEDLKDFPVPFEPIFSDLYPSTIRDVDWEETVAPDAERFLSTVQQYVHSKGIHDPEEGSPAWVFIEMFRPGVNAAIEVAEAYNKRMRQACRRVLGSSPQGSIEGEGAGRKVEAASEQIGTAKTKETRSPGERLNDVTLASPAVLENLVFVSYSRKDTNWLEKLETMLAPLVRSEKVPLWTDKEIGTGADWKREIDAAMKSAKVAVMLVSKNYLASKFINDVELPYIVESAKRHRVHPFCIYVSHCMYKETVLADIQAANNPDKPLNALSVPRQEKELVAVCEKLRVICATGC